MNYPQDYIFQTIHQQLQEGKNDQTIANIFSSTKEHIKDLRHRWGLLRPNEKYSIDRRVINGTTYVKITVIETENDI